jgi:hypothetical protein
MPDIPGRKKYKGYISPAPGSHSQRYAKVLSVVYGNCRVNNPGEIPSNKEYCAKVAHSTAQKIAGR